jgi:DNA-binding transcriptional ArsR family regulator
MSESSAPPGGCARLAPPLAGILALILICAGGPYYYFFNDYEYVQGTARQIQDAGVLATQAMVALLIVLIALAALYGLLYGALGLIGGYTRWASPAARHASMQIALKRADHLELPDGISTYTVTHNYRGERAPAELPAAAPRTIEGEVVPTPLALPAPHEAFVQGPSRLQQLVGRGDIVVGSDRLLTGYDAARKPRYIKAAELGLGIIVGQSHKGKSSLAGLIIAQAALAGWHIIVCDPVYHREERSLLREFLAGLTGAIYRQAVREEEIAAAVGLAMNIAQRRLEGDPVSGRVLLVVDEFSSVTGRKMLDADATENLFLTATKAAAVGVHTLVIAHDLSDNWFGGRAARRGRDQATHRLICNMTPTAAAPILPNQSYAQQVAMLPVGQALFFDGWDEPALVSFPKLEPADLAWAAHGRPPVAYAPWQPRAAPAVAAPRAPAALTPTEPLPAPRPPAALTTALELSAAELILDALAAAREELSARALAARTGLEEGTVRNVLGRLRGEGTITHRRKGKEFLYSVLPRAMTA